MKHLSLDLALTDTRVFHARDVHKHENWRAVKHSWSA